MKKNVATFKELNKELAKLKWDRHSTEVVFTPLTHPDRFRFSAFKRNLIKIRIC